LAWIGYYYVLFFIHLESRRVSLAGVTRHSDQAWMQQMSRNATGEALGFLEQRRYALHDHDTKFCSLNPGGATVKPIPLPARRPNLNAYAERSVRSAKEECLSKLILFGEASLRPSTGRFIGHYHAERNHQGKGNALLFPSQRLASACPEAESVAGQCLGGLLKYYRYAA
jgi:hypothetical protein